MDRNFLSAFDVLAIAVALRKESVDRNISAHPHKSNQFAVALRKESVDRNQVCIVTGRLLQVALRKESVDRNKATTLNRYHFTTSLSARRAWIEIRNDAILSVWVSVALRKESVDRNIVLQKISIVNKVALRKESVDRNTLSTL